MADTASHPNAPQPHDGQQPWTALITGGASGIRAATALKLASRSIDVLIADVKDSAGEKLVSQIKSSYDVDAFYLHTDVSKVEDVKRMVEAVVKRWGRPDYAANVAGICPHLKWIKDEGNLPVKVVQRTWEVNQKGLWLCQREEGEQMSVS